MENIVITKVRNNENGQECDVDWIFNIEKRKIEESLITNAIIKKIFGIDNIFDIKDTNLILFSNETSYYCHNCIFSFNILPKLCIYSTNIDYILVNSKNSLEELRINKFEMNIELSKDIKNNYITSNIIFKYNKFIEIELKKEYIDKKCKMTILINSSKLIKEKTLSNIAYNIYELLIIYFGVGIKISKRMYYDDSDCKELLSSIVDKYSFGIKNSNSFGNFVEINDKTINKDVLIKFEEFKEKTYLLNDVYLTVTNSNMYKEIKINMMVQAIEGFYKSINGKAELHDILYYTFMNNDYYCKLLSKKDKRNVEVGNRKEKIFLYKAKNHRNYFSHLNENERKKVFGGMELNYAYWKIYLAYRLLMLKYLNVPSNIVLLEEIISNIDEYANKYL